MRKTLIMLLILSLIVVVFFMMLGTLNIGGLQILGFPKLREENKKLDESIQNLSKLSSTGYQKALNDVSNSAKQYKSSKESYEQLVAVSSDGSISVANQLQKYEIEYLWTRLGAHATKENVVIKMDVSANASSSTTGYFDLNFTVSGSYVAITDFIYAVENDSSLGFKIENFKMTSGSATFKCTNIAINIDASELSSGNDTTEENGSSEENTNTNTNTTDTTNTTNTSNTTTSNDMMNTTNTNNITTNSTNSR